MKEFNRITVKVQAYFMKTLNSSSGKDNYFMRGGEVPYQYHGKVDVDPSKLAEFITENEKIILDDIKELRVKAKEKKPAKKIKVSVLKEVKGISRVIKGVRGSIRHSIMDMLFKKGIDYCSPTQKKEFQTGEPTLLKGEHLLDSCKEDPCPLSQLFGTINKKSAIRVWSDLIVQAKEHVAFANIIPQRGVSFVHVSTENRHQARRDKKSLQDFSEQHFSGEFQFYVEFPDELPEWLVGLLVEGILGISAIGRGSSSGYGRFHIIDMRCEKVVFERKLGEEANGHIAISEVEEVSNQNKQLRVWINSWKTYNQN